MSYKEEVKLKVKKRRSCKLLLTALIDEMKSIREYALIDLDKDTSEDIIQQIDGALKKLQTVKELFQQRGALLQAVYVKTKRTHIEIDLPDSSEESNEANDFNNGESNKDIT